MPKKDDYYHSILIVSSSRGFEQAVKKTIRGFATVDVKKSAAGARRCILERYYDLVAIKAPLPDETGEDFAIDVTEKCSASVLLVVPADAFKNALDRVTDHGVLVIPNPAPRGRMETALRYLYAVQDRMHALEKKRLAAEEKMEEMRIVNKAKFFLIESRHMTENEAHRLIGKQAMDNGISRKRAARRILEDA